MSQIQFAENSAENNNTQEEEVNLKEYLRILRRHLKLILAVFIIVMGATVYYTIKAPEIYESNGKVLLELNKQTELFMPTSGFGRNELNNQMQVIKSRPIMERAIEKLKRNENADQFPLLTTENPASTLRDKIEVTAEREVDIFNVKYRSTNPLEAKAVVNAVIESYEEENLKYTRAELTRVRKFLEEQLNKTQRKLAISEEDLRQYKLNNKVFALTEETEKMVENMAEFEGQLQIAATELQVARENLEYQRSELAKLDSSLAKAVTSISSPLLEQLRNQLIEKEGKLATLLNKQGYSAEHPELKILRQETRTIRNKMEEELKKVLQSKEESISPMERRQTLMTTIIESELEFQNARAKYEGLKKVVENYQTQMAVLPDAELELARLERAKKINQQVYSMLVNKYEEAKISEEGKLTNIRILQEAVEPRNPVSPKVKMNILIGIILGLGLGGGGAFLLESFDTKISTLSDVEKYIQLPVLGTIPNIEIDSKRMAQMEEEIEKAESYNIKAEISTDQKKMVARLITHYKPKSPISEAYRTFRTNLISKPEAAGSKTFLVTSSGPKEGKSTSSSNLAIALAQTKARTVLIDCDMRRPMLHNLFMFSKENGLSKYLTDETVEKEEIIKSTEIENLDLITSGHVPPNPSELFSLPRMNNLINQLELEYDYIVLDTPPIIAVTDALILAKKVDELVLVVRVDVADKNMFHQAKNLLKNVGVDITGIVVNGVEVKKYYSGYKYYYYYYYYYADEDKKGKRKRKTS